jgi:hypothetical protein
MKILAGLALGLLATPALADYEIMLGNFSDQAYGGGLHSSVSEPRQHYVPNYDDDEEDTIAPVIKKTQPKPKLITVAYNPTEDVKPTQPSIPEALPKKAPEVPPIPLEKTPGRTMEEQKQNALIDKVLVERAYAIRKAEHIKEWTCMAESGKQMLAHIEAEWGKVDIQTEGTCANRNIAGTGVVSQHAYGKAIDFHPGKKGSKKEIVAWLIKHRKEGWVSGIMTYNNYTHIHVDIGPHRFVSLGATG